MLRNHNLPIKKKDIRSWLSNQETYSIHRSPFRNFRRSQFITSKIDRFWSTDLIDMSSLSKNNDNIKFLLIVIDNFSKFAFIEQIKNKNSNSIIDAFKNIFEYGRKPEILISDAGKEFLNKNFEKFLKENNIKLYVMRNTEVKAAIAERFIRTIKEKIFKYIYSTKSSRYIDVLADILRNYNNTVHSTTLFKPNDVNYSNQNSVLLNATRKRLTNRTSKLKTGDKVRILKLKDKFEKGYKNNWTKEIFTIKRKLSTLPFSRFKLEDSNSQELIGSFYEKELLKI